MCLYLTDIDYTKRNNNFLDDIRAFFWFPKRAKDDIIVYKMLHKDSRPGFDVYTTPHRQLKLQAGQKIEMEGKLRAKPLRNGLRVEEGVHAYTGIDSWITATTDGFFRDDMWIIKMIVPKGKKYFKSFDGHEIVAEKLEWHRDYHEWPCKDFKIVANFKKEQT